MWLNILHDKHLFRQRQSQPLPLPCKNPGTHLRILGQGPICLSKWPLCVFLWPCWLLVLLKGSGFKERVYFLDYWDNITVTILCPQDTLSRVPRKCLKLRTPSSPALKSSRIHILMKEIAPGWLTHSGSGQTSWTNWLLADTRDVWGRLPRMGYSLKYANYWLLQFSIDHFWSMVAHIGETIKMVETKL